MHAAQARGGLSGFKNQFGNVIDDNATGAWQLAKNLTGFGPDGSFKATLKSMATGALDTLKENVQFYGAIIGNDYETALKQTVEPLVPYTQVYAEDGWGGVAGVGADRARLGLRRDGRQHEGWARPAPGDVTLLRSMHRAATAQPAPSTW